MRGEGRHDGANRLDLMRLVFASLVLVSHASEYVDGDRSREPLTRLFHTISCGELAVDGFFILSGFLIKQSWDRQPEAGAFLRKRVARIYPAFVVAALLSVLVVGRIGAHDPAGYYAALDPIAMSDALLYLRTPATPIVFAGYPYPWVNGATWTIQYEFGCYLALMVAGMIGLLRRRPIILMAWLAAIALYVVEHLGLEGGPVLYDPLGSYARFGMLFLSGIAFATFRFHRDRRPIVIGGALLGLLAGLTVPILAEPALATAGAYLILVFGMAPAGRHWPKGLPDISYGTYLYGAPVEMLILFHRPDLPPLLVFGLSLPLALMLGAASWRWIEAPVLRYAGVQRTGEAKRRQTLPATATAVAATIP